MMAVLSAFGWALKHWRAALSALGFAFLGIALMLAKADARHFRKLYAGEQAAHAQTVLNYRLAAEQARASAYANVDRVKTEQATITERVTNERQSKLVAANDRYERLRAQASGYLSRPGAEGVPDSRETTCRAVAGTDCDAIPALMLAAQNNTDQLIALQDWTRAQADVDFTGKP